jgi:hypothetical protein
MTRIVYLLPVQKKLIVRISEQTETTDQVNKQAESLKIRKKLTFVTFVVQMPELLLMGVMSFGANSRKVCKGETRRN